MKDETKKEKEEREERREKKIRKRRTVIPGVRRRNVLKLSYTSMCGMSKSIEDL
jgi:hypothetical protein